MLANLNTEESELEVTYAGSKQAENATRPKVLLRREHCQRLSFFLVGARLLFEHDRLLRPLDFTCESQPQDAQGRGPGGTAGRRSDT